MTSIDSPSSEEPDNPELRAFIVELLEQAFKIGIGAEDVETDSRDRYSFGNYKAVRCLSIRFGELLWTPQDYMYLCSPKVGAARGTYVISAMDLGTLRTQWSSVVFWSWLLCGGIWALSAFCAFNGESPVLAPAITIVGTIVGGCIIGGRYKDSLRIFENGICIPFTPTTQAAMAAEEKRALWRNSIHSALGKIGAVAFGNLVDSNLIKIDGGLPVFTAIAGKFAEKGTEAAIDALAESRESTGSSASHTA